MKLFGVDHKDSSPLALVVLLFRRRLYDLRWQAGLALRPNVSCLPALEARPLAGLRLGQRAIALMVPNCATICTHELAILAHRAVLASGPTWTVSGLRRPWSPPHESTLGGSSLLPSLHQLPDR